MGGGQSTSSTQTNEPPAWARPLLKLAGKDAMQLYKSGSGYNVYQGPTMANMSDATLGGMNGLLAATGYQGAPVQNQTAEQMFPDVMKLLAAQKGVNEPPPKSPQGPGRQQQWPMSQQPVMVQTEAGWAPSSDQPPWVQFPSLYTKGLAGLPGLSSGAGNFANRGKKR